ncbi:MULTISPECIES: NADH-quinone oxidoreductase subunit J family protein [Streptomyces]|uniref:NADH-quinone oxidoreductase subunit J n=2 Tax=Streptomyces TaxID=1883 RepID=A0A1E7M157_9ACTN|nr:MULTISPECIES: NADH-quinone oxidoreductase subunit J [Streptomyces]OEV22098.1 NADH:ubiquinone oxidoreductase subunit J [Streptomyces nanshensis]ONI49493.1 NADH:ubiquinone oxidoreductase subunit J [Streptomyces sp. IB2014 011-1]RDV51723.1 NADH-quinone oxidoreductase subunit J [Streptomyces sp. IB2014 011-12]
MGTTAAVLLWTLGVLALVGGVLVFTLNSMARVTFALLGSLVCVGGVVTVLGLPYLGVVIVLMMVMEMVIMAVFMIAYMMNPAGLMPMSMLHNKRGALAVSGVVFAALTTAVFAVPWPDRPRVRPKDTTVQVGMSLMGDQMLTMVTLGFVLLATMVGATVLATHRGRYDRFGDDLDQRPARDPAGGGVGR